nr:capsid protein [Dicistroviridae sp.]
MTTREDREHTIKDFLKRPIVIHTGLWSSTQTSETELFSANFPEALISNMMYQEKLRGFVGLRATLVVKVQVNSQPFQQGRLMLQYYPYAQYMPTRVELVNSTLQGRSGCPRSDLDLSVGTEIEMRIPYVSPHVYYNLITGQGSFGSIYLVVYSQLRDQVSGTGSIEYTVWAHLEDVDVQYPTGANIYTGNAPNYIQMAELISSGDVTEKQMKTFMKNRTYEHGPNQIFAQVGVELKQMQDSGAISAAVGQVSEAVSSLSKIPILGNYLSKPAWISAKLTDLLKNLGFSKPTTQGVPCESKLRTQNRMANFNGADTSHKMALSTSNELETKPGLAGTSADEMEFSHILSIPNYWDRFSWDTNQLTGSVLWDNYVTPFKVKPYSDVIRDRFRCTHMGYVANTFGYWRGSIVYTFKFVKTQYHSGRLRIGFIPFYFNTTLSIGKPDMSKVQQTIVDLRTSTEVSFTVPYISSRPWMFCIRPESEWLGENSKMLYNAVTGIVRVEVLNQLVAANNVHSAVDTIVEVHGGPDLTFALPNAPSYVPYSGDFNEMRTLEEEKEEKVEKEIKKPMKPIPEEKRNKIITQIMGENEAVSRSDAQHGAHPISIDTHPIKANWSPEAYCIGEKVMSVRQLIKRFARFFNGTFNNGADSAIIAPFSITKPVSLVGTNKTISMFEYYYFIYAFWRGSQRIKAVSQSRDVTTMRPYGSYRIHMTNSVQDTFFNLISRLNIGYPLQQTRIPDHIDNHGSSLNVVQSNIEGMLEFEVPYYNISHISPATVYDAKEEKPMTVDSVLKGHIPPVIVHIRPTNLTSNSNMPTNNSVSLEFYRAVGDDFSLLYLVGVPPLVNLIR